MVLITQQDLNFIKLDGMTHKEIEEKTGIKASSIQSRRHFHKGESLIDTVRHLMESEEKKLNKIAELKHDKDKVFDNDLAKKYTCKPLLFKPDPRSVPLGLRELLTG